MRDRRDRRPVRGAGEGRGGARARPVDGPGDVPARDPPSQEIEFGTNKELCRRLSIKKLPCVQFFQGSEGCVSTVMCGPSKFPDVRVRLESLLGEHPHSPDLPEFTDVSKHYNATDAAPTGG